MLDFANASLVTIQSVLDVRDDTPMPKGAVSSSCFGRSILILTPQRALKFTATTRERHHVWLSALSFLSHTSVLPTELGNFTTITADDTAPPPPPSRGGLRSATFQNDPVRRHAIRDSIRLAKGKGRNQSSKRSFTSPTNSSIRESEYAATHQYDDAAEDEDAAEPPLVPRTSGQTRKRSNTGPKSNRPSSSFRSYSSSAKPSTYSLQSRQESETSYGWMTDGGPTMSSRYGGVNQYTGGSDFHSPTQTIQGTQPNFFEAVGNVGTVRMEAFVRDEQGNYRNRKPNRPSNRNNGIVVIPGHPSVTSITGGYQTDGVVDRSSGVNAVGEKKERGSYRTRTGRKKDMRYWGAGSERLPDTTTQGHSGNNPFEGF